jgi:hypothetical protein
MDKSALNNDKNDSIFNFTLAFGFVYHIKSCMDWWSGVKFCWKPQKTV